MTRTSCLQVISRTSNILLKAGFLPTEHKKQIPVLKLIFHLTCYVVFYNIAIKNIINAIRAKDVVLLNRVMCTVTLPITTHITKTLTVIKNRKCFLLLLEDLNSDTFNSHSNEQNKIIQRVDYIAKLILVYYTIVGILFLSIASFFPVVMDIRMLLPMPYNIQNFDIFYKLLHMFIMIYFGFNGVMFELLYFSMMGLCAAQLRILQAKLTGILEFSLERKRHCSLNIHYIIEDTLKECVLLQELINRFVKRLSRLLSFPLFTQYVFGCLLITYAVLQLTLTQHSDTTNNVTVVAFAGAAFFQLGVYHWLGNEIIYESSKIVESCYLSNWYELNLKSQKIIILLMERAKRPLTMHLYKLVFVSLESLAVIVQWSYSLFALVRAKYN